MRSLNPVLAILAVILVTGQAAHASSDDDDSDGPVRVDILPQSHLQLGKRSARPALDDDAHLEFSASTWAPGDFETPSRLSGTSAFGSRGLPSVSAAFLFAPWAQPRWADISLRVSAALNLVQRSGTLPTSGGPQTGYQDGFLVPVSAGFEVSPALARWKGWSLHGAAALAPTLFVSERSMFDDGVSTLGLAGTLSLGAATDLRWLVRTGMLVTVDLVGSVGSADGGSLSGVGLSAGVRLPVEL